jgi:hypothetical protein
MMYLVKTEQLTTLGCPLNGVLNVFCGPAPQDTGTTSFLPLSIFNLYIGTIAVLENTNAGLHKRATFLH